MNPLPPSIETMMADAQRHHFAGRLAEAEAGYLDILRLKPRHTEAQHYLGVLCYQRGDAEAAVKLIARAIKSGPETAEMHLNMGAACRKLEDASRAVFAYRKAIALKPGLVAAYFQLGHALRATKDFEGAITAYNVCLKDRPEDAPTHIGIACAHAGVGRYDEAMTSFDRAITFDPNFAEAYSNIGTLLSDQGRFQTALPFHEKAVDLSPDVPEWNFELSLIFMRLGRLAEGWPRYESRCDKEQGRIIRHAAPPPYWRGEPLKDKRILVWMEQGLGDQILFASMLPDVVAQAGHCTIECAPRLAPVFARSFPTATVVGNADLGCALTPAKDIDYQIAAGSLGQHVRESLADFPRHGGYLAADPIKTATLRTRYEKIAQGRRIVGISWRTHNAPNEEFKSVALLDLAPILETPGVLFVNLQYGPCAHELGQVEKKLGVDILHDTEIDPLLDMDAFCAQVAAMDLVITTSNTSAHVAGAMNIPVWILLPLAKGVLWYWFAQRSDSPWYPSAQLFRDNTADPIMPWWKSTARAAAEALRAWLLAPLQQ